MQAVLFSIYTVLDDGGDVLDAVPAVVFEPLADDRHQSADIKRHEICAIRLRHMEPVEDRREHILIQAAVGIVHPENCCLLDCCAENAAMFFYISQIRRQILRTHPPTMAFIV